MFWDFVFCLEHFKSSKRTRSISCLTNCICFSFHARPSFWFAYLGTTDGACSTPGVLYVYKFPVRAALLLKHVWIPKQNEEKEIIFFSSYLFWVITSSRDNQSLLCSAVSTRRLVISYFRGSSSRLAIRALSINFDPKKRRLHHQTEKNRDRAHSSGWLGPRSSPMKYGHDFCSMSALLFDARQYDCVRRTVEEKKGEVMRLRHVLTSLRPKS